VPNTPAAPVSATMRVLQYNQIVATANEGVARTLDGLVKANIVPAARGQQIAVWSAGVAKATMGIAQIMPQNVPWPDKVIQLQDLALSLVPPAGYQQFGVKDDVQWQALITAMDSIESTIRIMVQIAKQSPSGT
jgi:hypothetical protein